MAANKPESKDAKEPKEAKEGAPAPERPAPPAAPRFAWSSWVPALIIVAAAPAASWGVTQYLLLPRLLKKLADPATLAAATPAAAPAASDSSSGKAPENPPSDDFTDIVVNLAGTMGTRYLKTAFTVTGTDPNFKQIFEDNRMRLKDVTINVLSSLTLSDLEEPGSKNVLREKLVTAYNQALGRKLCDQVFFSDFVVQ